MRTVADRPTYCTFGRASASVLSLGAAGTGVEGNGVIRIVLAGQQRAQTRLLKLLFKLRVLALELRRHRIVVLLYGHFAWRHQIIPAGAELLVVFNLALELLQTFLNALGFFDIVPEAVACALTLKLLDLFLGRLKVQRLAQ